MRSKRGSGVAMGNKVHRPEGRRQEKDHRPGGGDGVVEVPSGPVGSVWSEVGPDRVVLGQNDKKCR